MTLSKLLLIAATVFAFVITTVLQPSAVLAACPAGFTCLDGCENVGQCSDTAGKRCESRNVRPDISGGQWELAATGATCGGGVDQEVIGRVTVPMGINFYSLYSGSSIGALSFINTLLTVFFAICVVWFLINLVLTGAKIVSNPGDAKAMEELKEALTYPIIGMIILAASFLISTLIGIFFFGDANFITNPTLPRAEDFK